MKKLTCIVCPNGCSLSVYKNEDGEWLVEGNKCPKGKKFAVEEMTSPVRSVCSTVKTIYKEIPRLSVRTNGEIPLNLIFDVMKEINEVTINKPLHNGDIVLENVLNTGINLIATSDMYYYIQEEMG